MDSNPTDPSCDRIEAALVRIEAALTRRYASAPAPHAANALDDLTRRHALLREAAARSLLMIDALIDGRDPDAAA